MNIDPKFEWMSGLVASKVTNDRFVTNLPPDPALTAKFATISNVSDPLSMGRVKLTYENEGNSYETSNWCYVSSHPGGNLSTEFIGQKCLVVFESADPNNAIVLAMIPSNGNRAIGSPVKVPVIKIENSALTGQVPDCNQSNLGSILLFEEISGTAQRICRRDDQGEYSWMSNMSPQVVRTNTVQVESPDQKIGDPIGQYVPGNIFVRKTCERDQFTAYIADYSESGNPRYRPLSAAPVFNRSTIPDCNSDTIGTIGLFDEGNGETYTGICGKKASKFKWLTLDSREPIKFNVPFEGIETSSEYIVNKTQRCDKPSDLLGDSDQDKVNRKVVSPLSDVPVPLNPLDLTSFINTDGFNSQLKEELESQNADKGSRDRASALRTQINQTAFRVADNNITLIERYLIAQQQLFISDFMPRIDQMLEFFEQIIRALEEITIHMPGEKKARLKGAVRAQTIFRNLVKSVISRPGSGTRDQFKNFQDRLSSLVDEQLIQSLTPGQPGQVPLSSNPIDTINSITPALPIPIELTTDDYKLSESIEINDPEGTQVGTEPVNVLNEIIDSSSLSFVSYLNTVSNLDINAFETIASDVVNSFQSSLSSEIQSQFEKIRGINFSSLNEIISQLIPSTLISKLDGFLEINNDGSITTPNISDLQNRLNNTIFGESVTPFNLSNIELTDIPFNILNILSENGNNYGLTFEESQQISFLKDNLNRDTNTIEATPQFIRELSSITGVSIPFDDGLLEFIGADVESIAELAANSFFDPLSNKANYGELIQLMVRSDIDARQYIDTIITRLSGIEIPQEKLTDIVNSFRNKIDPAGVAEPIDDVI